MATFRAASIAFLLAVRTGRPLRLVGSTERHGRTHASSLSLSPCLLAPVVSSLAFAPLQLCHTIAQAAVGDIAWAQNMPGMASGGADGWGVAMTPDGTVITVGTFTFGGTTMTAGGLDAFVTKTTSDGTPVWAIKLGSPDANGRGVGVDKNTGDAVACGTFMGTNNAFGAFTLTSPFTSMRAGYCARVSPSGTVLWAKMFAGTNGVDVNAATVDGAGNSIVVGDFAGTMQLTTTSGSVTLTGIGGTDWLIIKQNANGDFLWAKSYGASFFYGALWGVYTNSFNDIYINGGFDRTFTIQTLSGASAS